jgi:hypothetical protein
MTIPYDSLATPKASSPSSPSRRRAPTAQCGKGIATHSDEQTPGETPDETPGDAWEEGIRESITNNRSFISEAAAGAMP